MSMTRDRRRADGVRHARPTVGDPAATTPTSGAGARPPTSSSPTSPAATTRSAGCRRCWSAPRPSAARVQARARQLAPAHVPRSCSGSSTPTRRSRRPSRTLAAPGRRARSSALVLAPHYSALSVGQYLVRLDDAAGADTASSATGIRVVGDRAGVRRLPRRRSRRPARSDAGRNAGGLHRPLAAGARRRGRRPVPGRAAGDGRGGRRAARPGRGRAMGDRLAERRAHARAVADARHPRRSSTASAATRRSTGVLVCACGFVADHLEVLYDLDIEARRRAESARPALRPHRVRQRRSRGDGGAGGRDRRARRADRADMTDRRVLVVGGGITGLAAAARLSDTSGRRRRAVGGASSARRQDRHLAVRRVGHVDEGADAYLTRVPHAVAFARKVGLASGRPHRRRPTPRRWCGTTACTRSPAGSCSAFRPRCDRSSPPRC